MTNESTSPLWQYLESLAVLPPLVHTEVQVWRIDLPVTDAQVDACFSYLTEEERARANRRKQPQDRRHAVVGRACLRNLLGKAESIDPREVPITTGTHGKPQSTGNIAFNVAHSGNIILIALSRGATIGVDIEQISLTLDYQQIAAASFTPTEQQFISTAADPRTAFYQLWTRKEAIAKADGCGLNLPLTSIDTESPAPYSLFPIPIDPTFAAALAVDIPNYTTRLLRFPLLDILSASH